MAETSSSTTEVTHVVEGEIAVKTEGGQMAKAKDVAEVFLHKRFPGWKDNNTTYLIPPVLQSQQSRHQIGITQSVPFVDPGDRGEGIIYNLLKRLGDDGKMGMFVVQGFKLKDITKWNKKYKNYLVPKLVARTGECDFIIFHHQLGIISIEVKNCSSVSQQAIEEVVQKAEDQLDISQQLITNFANSEEGTPSKSKCCFPYKKVIALPSTKKANFKVQLRGHDTLLLFEDDSRDISSFREWWNKAIESPAMIKMSAETEAYERALSYILMIRHMSPVTDVEYIKEIQKSLDTYKYHGNAAYPQLIENMFPYLWKWCWNVLSEKYKKYPVSVEEEEKDPDLKKKAEKEKEAEEKEAEEKLQQLQQSFMKNNKLSEKDLRGNKGKKLLNKLLENSKYIDGDKYSLIDDAIFALFEESYCLFHKHTVDYINRMRKVWLEIEEEDTNEEVLKKYPFLKLESPKDLNMLDRHLATSPFIDGNKPSAIDKQVLGSLTCRMRLKHACHPIVMTSEQLVVFEGPSKQLIIGPPGSGKTELLRFKALELDIEMKKSKRGKKIMYILANGCSDYPERNSLFFYHIKKFFKKSHLVEVISIVMKDESREDTDHTTSEIRKKIQSGEYEHAFIDEYWIGSRTTENNIIQELVRGLPGYVWISSVFNYQPEAKKVKANTQPLLTALHENGGEVRHITQVMRATNSITELERDYSKLYADRSYPYGTERILGHSYEGLPVTWAVEENVSEMYDKCVDIVYRAITDVIPPDILKRDNITLDPADILIVDFAIRMDESRQLEQSLMDRLTNRHVPVWTFGQSPEQIVEDKTKKVTLLQSVKRKASEFLDGIERPMVVVILPSGMVLKTAKLADEAERLRNYDTYISFFRTMVKLVVISDKWTNKEEFLSDVKDHM
ncbi:Hypothetical predicted protein [Paramuricea clavata]|uniref:Uncharacterized protein n=1 Tax=Paramuricea clavata TaxID=317549 RepID=A0A6S7JZA5_PARCT|nr:Hypothetical predicted protein [Paramuricea clavata]